MSNKYFKYNLSVTLILSSLTLLLFSSILQAGFPIADFDDDYDVDTMDLSFVAEHWLDEVLPAGFRGDLNEDQKIDLFDIADFGRYWGYERKRQLPAPALGVSSNPYYMDVAGQPDWLKFAAVCMQGFVNRQQGKLYLKWDDSDDFWLTKYNEIGYGIAPVNIDVEDITDYVAPGGIFDGVANGLLLYDDSLMPGGVISPAITFGQWFLNETSGQTAADSSSYNTELTLNGTANWSGTDFLFTSNSYFKAERADGFPFDMRDSFTLSMDIKTTTANACLFARTNGSWELGTKQFNIQNGRLFFDSCNVGSLGGNIVVNDNQWHKVEVRFDALAGTVSLYVDGNLDVSSNVWSNMAIFNDNWDLYLGYRGDWGYYSGYMKNVELRCSPISDSGTWTMLVNVFTAIAAAEDLIPVPASQAAQWSLPVVIDATTSVNRTPGLWAGGNDQDSASQWVIQNYPQLIESGPIAHLHPSTLNLRDYFVAFKIMPMFYWDSMSSATVTAFDYAALSTGPGQAVIGIWNIPGYGELGNPPGIGDEHSFLREVSAYGKYNVVTLENGISNLSYQSGMQLKKNTYTESQTPIELDSSKVYVTFNVSDGDNVGYLWRSNAFPSSRWWGDPARGQVAINWTMAPISVDLLPGMVSYFYLTATAKDGFSAGGGGIGYTLLEHYANNYPSQRDDLIRDFARISDDMMELIDIRTVWSFPEYSYVLEGPPSASSDLPELTIFNNEASKGFEPLNAVMLDYGNRGGLAGYDDTNMIVEDVPMFMAVTDGCATVMETADRIRSYAPATKPAFIHVFLTNWCWTPTQIKQLADELGSDYVPVSAEKLGILSGM